MREGVLFRYKEFLPVTAETPLLSMGEGGTPLVRSRFLETELNCGELYFKLEGTNPSGSFKDRGMVVAVAKALEAGNHTILCASTGNTSASAAAYGAYAGMRTLVLMPKGNVAMGKLAQAIAYGAQIIDVNGNFDLTLRLAREMEERFSISLVNSVNPHRIQGQKTAAFEIVDVLGDAPDYLFIPVGNAGNITAYWLGFQEYKIAEQSRKSPKMMGFQAEGSAPIVKGHVIDSPQTIASAIRIGNPASWHDAEQARDDSEGVIDAVSDQDILEAYKMLARREGIFCEAASAASVAGLRDQVMRLGLDLRGKVVVCVITGSGLKDPDLVKGTLEETDGSGSRVSFDDVDSIAHVLGLQ